MSENVPGEKITIREKLRAIHNERESRKRKEREMEMEMEKKRILSIIDIVDNWKFTTVSDIRYKIPQDYFWVKVTECKNKFDLKFYSEIAAENDLTVRFLREEDSPRTCIFECPINNE